MGFLSPKVPASSTKPTENLEADKRKLKKSRSKLFATEGEQVGEEVGAVQRRSNLFGN